MGKEKGPDFYTGKGYMKSGAFKNNLPIYQAAFDMLPHVNECKQIIELGCGVGYFAQLTTNAYNYIGIDFSKLVINKAIEINPNKKFILGNLLDNNIIKLYKKDCIYVCLETIEHIQDDIKLIKSIPSGSYFIFSVPNRDFTSHVRFFKNKNEIIKRYSNIIDFHNSEWKVLNTNPKKNAKVFVCRAIIK